jgi:hypothetical protein
MSPFALDAADDLGRADALDLLEARLDGCPS